MRNSSGRWVLSGAHRREPSPQRICWVIRWCALSMSTSRPGMTDKDCRCLWILSASRAAAFPYELGRLPREPAGTARPADRRTAHAAGRRRLSRLFHPARRQPVHQLSLDGCLGGLPAARMLPAIEQRFGCGGTGRRGVFGKSSGGYGAITHALRHSDIWAAAACHSGDMGFEFCYLPDMPAVLRALAGAENSSRNGGSSSRRPKSIWRVPSRWSTRWRWRPAMIPIPRSSWDPAVGHVRHLRGYRGTLGELDAARPCSRDRDPGGEFPQAEGALHRLR